jgi:hypothetical protein
MPRVKGVLLAAPALLGAVLPKMLIDCAEASPPITNIASDIPNNNDRAWRGMFHLRCIRVATVEKHNFKRVNLSNNLLQTTW